ncbi:hypothetical protein BSLA_01f5553 [Burkholderia stabilis]|nr:hypothetical protein BSLA_01f5553 [Burkholderia stabilis]
MYHTRESNLSRLATQVTGTSTGAPHRSASLLDALRGMLVSAEALTIIDTRQTCYRIKPYGQLVSVS